MKDSAPVIIVDEDLDDRELVKAAWKELKFDFPLIFFNNGEDLLDYLDSKPKPFLIISDVNLPKMDGFKLREKIVGGSAKVKYKSIPFIFWSGTATEQQIKKAYDLSSHGFFIKEPSYDGLQKVLSNIVSYWLKSETPENV